MEINRILVANGNRIYEDQEREIKELAQEYGVNPSQMHRDILDKGLEAIKTGIKKAVYEEYDVISIRHNEIMERFRIETGRTLTKLRK